ncbi:YfhO family protein [Fontisphaera persica]|uniref:YfhO family protein n=1 Tax=Fontisphaera persica TaxID=2974023 RepID=UPI0024C01D86|nr:YfhO family protein [Fontisphaera persica]WCJ59373.1 YfhO family protein [Fontisphaera persica]
MAHNGTLESAPATPARWLSPFGFALALLAALGFCFPGVAGGWEAFFYRDHGVLAYPSLFHLKASLAEGEFPLWNPLSNCGAPFAAQWGPMAYYPGLWLFLALPLPQGLGWFCLAHLLWAGLGMYFLARQWTGQAVAATLAGWWYVFNGATFSCLMWPNYVAALAWMPWVLWSAERAWQHGGRSTLLASAFAALQLLTGVPELIALTWLAIIVLAALACFAAPGFQGKILLRLGAIILLAAGLAAVQLLPFFELLAHSHRAAGGIVTKWTMPVWGLANLVLPLFHCFETPEGVFYQHGQNFLSSYYPGVLPLVLAVWAVAFGRQRRVLALAALTLAAYWLAMGDQGGLYAALKWLFPPLEVLRFPVKFVLLPAFLLPLLAAHAVADILPHSSSARPVWTMRAISSFIVTAAVLLILVALASKYPMTYDQPDITRSNAWARLAWLAAALAALLGLTHPRLARLAVLALLTLCLGDLWTHAPRQNPTLPVKLADLSVGLFEPGFWKLAQKSNPPRHGDGRIFISPEAEQSLLHARSGDLRERWLERRTAQWSHLNLLERIPKVNGSSTLQIREQRAVEDLFYKVHTNQPPSPLLDFLAVTHQTAPGLVNHFLPRTNALPLVTAGQRAAFLAPTHLLNALAAPDFNPAEVVYFPEELRGQVTVTQAAPARLTLRAVQAHRLQFDVESPAAALVVVSQSFYPAWRTFVDGQPVPLWRANHAFQALAVPPGKHQIEVKYVDRWFHAGLLITSLTALVMLWLARPRRTPAISSGGA